jgi:hypothetical protein
MSSWVQIEDTTVAASSKVSTTGRALWLTWCGGAWSWLLQGKS